MNAYIIQMLMYHTLIYKISLMKEGTIISFDNMNDYYNTSLKEYRLSLINEVAMQSNISHIFIKGNVSDKELVEKVFEEYQPDIVVHLAAQAGVRYMDSSRRLI